MNVTYKKMSSMILAGLIAATMPVCATDTPEQETKKTTSVWYKKRSVQAAGAVGIMGVIYMLATHMDKIAPVAFFAALFSKMNKPLIAGKTASVAQNNPVTEQNSVVTQQQEIVSVPVTTPDATSQPHVQMDAAEKSGMFTGFFNQVASYVTSWKPSLPQITRDELDIMVSPY